MLGGDRVVIETRLGADGESVCVHVDGGRVVEDLWVHFPVPMMRAWDNVAWTCSMMLVFGSEKEVDEWCERHGVERGSLEPIEKVWGMARV